MAKQLSQGGTVNPFSRGRHERPYSPRVDRRLGADAVRRDAASPSPPTACRAGPRWPWRWSPASRAGGGADRAA